MPLYRNPDFRRLPNELAAIFAQQASESFFDLPGWYDVVARHGVSEGTEIRIYADDSRKPSIALVLRAGANERDRRLASLANLYTIEHSALAAPGADRERGFDSILSEILTERPRRDGLALAALDPLDPLYAALVRACRCAGLFVEGGCQFGTWYDETVGLDFARYLAQRPATLRNTWRRKSRRVATMGGLHKVFFPGGIELEPAIAAYETVYAASWKPAEPFPLFMPALIRFAAEIGALRLGLYYIQGIPAAVHFWIVWQGRAVIYKLAHDKRFDALSLGTLLTMDMIERALDRDRPREISFGRGDDPYKRAWLPRRRERWCLFAANPRTAAGLGLGLWGEAAKLYHRLRSSRLAPRAADAFSPDRRRAEFR